MSSLQNTRSVMGSFMSVDSSGTYGISTQCTLTQRYNGPVPWNGGCGAISLAGGSMKALKPLDVGSMRATYIGMDNICVSRDHQCPGDWAILDIVYSGIPRRTLNTV